MKTTIILLMALIFISCSVENKIESNIEEIIEQKEGEYLDQELADVAQRQLDAYNARDIEKFLSFYSDTCTIRDHSTGKVLMKGKEALRERYGEMFETLTELDCKINKRITVANYVIDEEIVTGLRDSGTVHAVAVYEIKNDSIVSVLFVR